MGDDIINTEHLSAGHSALSDYYASTNRVCCGKVCGGPFGSGSAKPLYHPIVVTQTPGEHRHMLADALTLVDKPCTVKTVILPEGVGIDDPRLKKAASVTVNRYELEAGRLPDFPILPFLTDVHYALVPPCDGPVRNTTTRYQVIPSSLVATSEYDAAALVDEGVILPSRDIPKPAWLAQYDELTNQRLSYIPEESAAPMFVEFSPSTTSTIGSGKKSGGDSRAVTESTAIPASTKRHFSDTSS